MGDAERALEAAQGAANLRQFDLAPRRRGTRALRAGARRFLSHEWRPVRLGLAALVLLHLLGLNAHAWQQREALAAKRLAMAELLRSTHPGVRAVLDAPVQMQRGRRRLARRPGPRADPALRCRPAHAGRAGLGRGAAAAVQGAPARRGLRGRIRRRPTDGDEGRNMIAPGRSEACTPKGRSRREIR
jgi:general secretion pathway protein L